MILVQFVEAYKRGSYLRMDRARDWALALGVDVSTFTGWTAGTRRTPVAVVSCMTYASKLHRRILRQLVREAKAKAA